MAVTMATGSVAAGGAAAAGRGEKPGGCGENQVSTADHGGPQIGWVLIDGNA